MPQSSDIVKGGGSRVKGAGGGGPQMGLEELEGRVGGGPRFWRGGKEGGPFDRVQEFEGSFVTWGDCFARVYINATRALQRGFRLTFGTRGEGERAGPSPSLAAQPCILEAGLHAILADSSALLTTCFALH